MPKLASSDLNGLPFYDEPITYLHLGDRLRAWEFNGWKPESLSWKKGCYIHTGLSNTQFNFTGPDVEALFSSICVNSFAKFPVGSMKHAIMCTEDGLIATHAITQRNDENEYRFFAGIPWPLHALQKSKFRVKAEFVPSYLTQVAGPTSLATLERATGESLADIGFLKFRKSKIAGKTVEVGRIGMSGNLAYEVRGPLDEGSVVYDAIYRAGQDFGIQRLGWRTYLVNHVEGGFPQMSWTFWTSAWEDPEFKKTVFKPAITGSVDPANMRARYRTPLEVGWEKAVRFDHEFLGRKALEAEAANPRRTVATLRWNPDDVIDIFASLLKPGEEYKTIDLPTSPTWVEGFLAHADHILKDGREVGVSSGTIYSYFFREVLSMACIDIDQAKIGNEVIVQWGDHGKRIKNVRATVERFPYLTEGRNDQVDAASLSPVPA
jgi:glycine cleavage system aminomethyltransferase T